MMHGTTHENYDSFRPPGTVVSSCRCVTTLARHSQLGMCQQFSIHASIICARAAPMPDSIIIREIRSPGVVSLVGSQWQVQPGYSGRFSRVTVAESAGSQWQVQPGHSGRVSRVTVAGLAGSQWQVQPGHSGRFSRVTVAGSAGSQWQV